MLIVRKHGKAVAVALVLLMVSQSLISWPPSVVRQTEVKLMPLGVALPLSWTAVVLPEVAERLWQSEVAADGSLWGLQCGANKGYWARDETWLSPVGVNKGYRARDMPVA